MKRFLILLLCHRIVASDFEDRIVNGPNADIERFPHMASTHLIEDQLLICSGAIISATWILTAAHCEYPVDEFRIRVGSSFVGHDGEVYTPAEFIPYPYYHMHETKHLDIALIKVATRIKFSRLVQPLKMAGPDTKFPFGTGCELAGFGRTSIASEDKKERRLRFIGMPILPHGECESRYRSYFNATMVCAGFTNVRAGVCSVSYSK
jgi:Trypsin